MGPKKQAVGKKLSQKEKSGSDGNIQKYLTPNEKNKENSPLKNPPPKRKRSVNSTPPLGDTSKRQTRESLLISKKSTEEEQEFTVNLGDGGKDHVVIGKTHDSIYKALMAQADIHARLDKEKGKEIHLLGKKGIEGYVNLGMPLQYVPENSHFEMKFYKVNRNPKGVVGYRQFESKGKKCVIFYVSSFGNRLENNARYRILWCRQLVKDLSKLCVFAPEGETIKDALCKDGRFHSCLEEKEWKLVENGKCRTSNHCVDNLANKSFEVVVKTKQPFKARDCSRNDQSCMASEEGQGKTYHYFKPILLDLYPDLKKQSTVIDELFAKAFAKALEEGKSKRAVFKLYRENFGKETKNSILIKVHKRLGVLSDSVGFIEWANNGNNGSATCFVLHDKYVLTCHHVVGHIVGEGVEEKDWASIISHSARVTFSYEDKYPKENSWFSLAPWFEISDKDLDFAVLKLEGDRSSLPAGLVRFSHPLPFNGLIYIIGHPDGQAKSADGCTVVPVFERKRECHCRVQRGQKVCNSVRCGSEDRQCIHMFTQRSFQEVINNPNVVTYDTSFFFGSSGSPVFNADGQLVAMHTAGYKYEKNKQLHSIVEFGFSMVAILAAIKKKYKAWYEFELLSLGEDARSCPGEHENFTSAYTNDIEMENLE
ncbi:protein FAM111A-like [Gopherus evgoodei]|uniref:protein FAM111A-like n=1 Tax=Gopherus evgoodei TaxID=1825980 RepID=UPI0011D001D5|nr:protein FAM111A-like [Gopherus evgoodei]